MYINSDKFEMLKDIAALRMVCIDLQLYLNTHPMDKEAIAQYNCFTMELSTLKHNYERMFGMLSTAGTVSPYPWQWINEPWPWEYEANYKIQKEEM